MQTTWICSYLVTVQQLAVPVTVRKLQRAKAARWHRLPCGPHRSGLRSAAGRAKQNNTYYCKAIFRVAEGKLVYYLSDVLIESSVLVMKKVTAMEKLQPEKKASHKEIMDDFVQVESQMLNRMFDFIATHQLSPITHWNEISIGKPVKGMTEDECRLAFGKPQTVLESNGEVQWMYSSSFYVFFKNGRVETIIK